MPNPSTYPYRRFPTIQVGAADHAARGTDAVKQELHALCAGSSKTVVTVECYPGTDQAEILALFPHAELVIHADDLAILPAELDAKIEHELTDDPVFGIMTTWQMKNFYPEEALCAARGKIDAVTDGLVLVYGVGASLVERADITIYICPVCFWENDPFITSDNEPSDSNHGTTLKEAKSNFLQFGACVKEMLHYVRPPRDDEKEIS